MVEDTKTSDKWKNFRAQLRDIWTDLEKSELSVPPESSEELVDLIQKGTSETRKEVRRKVEFLVDRFDVPFKS